MHFGRTPHLKSAAAFCGALIALSSLPLPLPAAEPETPVIRTEADLKKGKENVRSVIEELAELFADDAPAPVLREAKQQIMPPYSRVIQSGTGRATLIFRPRFTSSKRMFKALDGIISGSTLVEPLEEQNQIVINADAKEIESYKEILEAMDIPSPQILIEAKVVEVMFSDGMQRNLSFMFQGSRYKVGAKTTVPGNTGAVNTMPAYCQPGAQAVWYSFITNPVPNGYGGYYPAGLSFEAARAMMKNDHEGFKEQVHASLRRHVAAINELAKGGMHFWDYGNAFLLEASRAGADVVKPDGSFKYPSYVEDIMGPMCFDYGFGPFRWVCCSGDPADLALTDALAAETLEKLAAAAPEETRQQNLDNLRWIREAGKNKMVVGSQARILYADRDGRRMIAEAFNQAVADGRLKGPIVLGRDHHDVSGTDSPWRETANIRDGSRFTADMAVQNFCGDAFRGATWVSLHNGGGVGWGEVTNGGFGMLLDGGADASRRARTMLCWDVANGVARRAWARNEGAVHAIKKAMADEPRLKVTLPETADPAVLDGALDGVGL